MGNRKIALLILGVYALSFIASAITVQPVQAAVAAGYSEYFIPGSTDQLFRFIKDNDNDPDLGNQYLLASLSDWMGAPSEAALAQGISLPAEINKSFSPITIVAGQVSRLSVTIYNPNAFSLTNAAWTDNMPAGIFLANPVNSATTCGGTVTGVPGANTFSLSGGTVPAQTGPNPGSCTVSVDVSSITPGNLINMIPANGLTSTGGGVSITNTTPASATLQVNAVQPPSLNKNFSPNTIWAGNTSVLTINVLNNDLNNALTNVSLTDTMLPNVKLASPVGASLTNCGAGVLTAVSGASTLTLSGASIPKSSTCVITVNVTSTVQGSYLNTIPASAIASAQGVTNAAAASATLNVQMLSVTKNFVATTLVAGSTTPLTITLSNPTNADYTGVHLSDTLPAPFIIAAAPAPVNNCGGALIAVPGTNLIDLTGGTIPRSVAPPAVSTCTITVTVTAPLSALTMSNQTNTIPAGSMTTDQGITNPSPATDQMAVQAALVAGKSFTPASISPGGTTTVSITLRNHTAAAFTGVNLTDTLPAGLTVLGTPTTPQCGGVITNDATSVTITGGTIAAGATCTITFQVTASATGSLTNTIPVGSVTTAQGATNVTQASTTVTVASSALPVTSSKSFSPTTIVPGGNTRLRIDVRAPADSGLSNLSITDVLPAGMTVSNSTPPTISNCGASRVLTAPTGATIVSLTNGTVLAGQTCRIDVYVTTSTPGVSVNSIPAGNITYSETRPLTPPAPANLIVTGLSMSKAFYPPVVNPNGFSRLTITLTNTAQARLTNASLTDPLPTNVYVAAVPNAVSTCGGTVTAVANTQTISLTNGIIPAQVGAIAGVCTISVDVQGRGVAATRTNTIPVGNLSATIEGDGTVINPTAAATANLTIGNLHIVVNKAFNPLTVHGGSASVMSIELRNPDNAALSGIQFTDTMPAGMVIANPPNFNGGTCGAVPTGVIGSNVVTFSGGTLAPASSCTMTLNVTMNVNGNLTNTIPVGAVTTFNGVANTSPAAASLTNLPGASVSKYFAESSILAGPGSSTLLTITIQNTSAFALTGLGLIDNLPAGLQVSPATAPVNNCTGTLTAVPGTQLIQLSGGTLAGNSTCTLVVPVNGPLPGVYTNTIPIGALTNNEGTTNTEPASDTLTLTGAPALNVTKTLTSTGPLTLGSTLTYEIIVENTGNIALSNVTVADQGMGVVLGACSPAQPASLAPGAIMTCVASHVITQADIDAGSYTNTATAGSAETPTDMDSETVTIPQIRLTKTANPTSRPETAGPVGFSFVVENTGAEDVTLTDLTDDKFGNLNGQGTCSVPQTIPVGGSYSCTVTKTLGSDTLTAHTNIATATAEDKDGSKATDDDDAVVTFTNVTPLITVAKTANPTSVPETGGNVTFTYLVINNSSEAVTITSLVDDQFGPLLGDADCQTGTVLPVNASCFFTADFPIPAGSPSGSHINTFTVTADDNDGSTATASDDETVTYTNVPPEIAVTKTADQKVIRESGDSVTFTFIVENVGLENVTLTSLMDDVFGDLDDQGTCSAPQTITVGGSYTCQFTTTITGDSLAEHVNTVTAVAEDNDGSEDSANDSETITFTDEAPSYTVAKIASPTSLPETGGSVTFTFEVVNTGREALTLSDLTDSVYGNLNGQGDCSVPQTIPVGGSYTCSIIEDLSSDTLVNHTNTVTATVGDNDGNTTTGSDGETVTFTDELPVISVTKDVDPTTLPEEGGPATFTYTVTNDSGEPVEITALVDGVFGPLTGDADCQVGTVLDPGESCAFKETFPIPAGEAGDTHVSDFTAGAEDNEGNTATDTDDATVTYTDTPPSITVTKTADQTSLPETGGNVIFTFLVENTGLEAVTLTSLVDSVFGNLNGQGNCSVPQTIAVDGSYTCEFTTIITGDSLVDHVNTVTAIAEDNDGSTATDDDNETITFTDVQPAVAITKTANPTSVPETGGAVTFTFVVENTGQEAVTLTSLVDDVFGSLNGQGTCTVPQTITAGASYTCSITQTISGDTTANHTNTITASFGDNDGNTDTASDDAVVTFSNAAPEITVLKTAGASDVPETGGSVTYTYTVNNAGTEPVTISSLMDDPFGVLPGDADCQVGTVLAGGESCAFDATFTLPASDSGETHTNTFTAVASDNEGGSDNATEDETVTYTDVEPQISVLKTASVIELAETGGDVTFTYTVTNLGAEPAMIISLYDDPFGELEGDTDCNYATTLAGGASCSFEATFTLPAGEPGDTHLDIFTASVMDDEENSAEASEDETVTYTNVLPDIRVLKTAATSEVVETGGDVTFTFTVTNNSLEDAAITALTDDRFGTLAGDTDCQVGTVLAGGATCSFDAVLVIPAGAVGSTHVNTFTAAVEDNDGSSDSASESETITYTAAPAPAISVLKEVFAGGSWWDANASPGPEIRYGQSPQFRFTVRNTGNVTLTGITLSDSLYSTASCTIPASLSPNDGVDGSGTDEFSCTITAAWALGQHTNTATASASYAVTPVSASDDANYVGVNNAADLAVTKTDGVATYTPGGLLTYTIVVTNNGPDPVTGATFTDAIPAQIARWTWTCAQAGGASGCTGVTNSTVNFTNTIDLPVGGSITYTVTATTRSSATTALTNTASVSTPAGTDDTNPGNNSASDVDTAAPRVNLSLNKTVDGQFRSGATLGYTLTVTNNGPSDAVNVIVSDMLPGEVTFVSANPAITSGPNPVTWNLGTLASGATRSIRLVVRVKDWVNQPFSNTASVTSTTPESNVTDNSDVAVADPEEPTPVTLLYFRAAPSDGMNVKVEWKAETEVDHFAYKLYRSTTPVFEDAEELTVVGPNPEKTYSYTDTVPTAGNYYYWLVDISTTNAIEVHEPVLVIFNALRFYLPVIGR